MSFDPYQIDLPITEVIAPTRQHLAQENTLIVHAPPGAGKSTLLPLSLLEENWLNGKKIIMLEPRRLAARSIAVRMSELIGEPVGKTVGYRIRFDTKVSEHTRIEVVTEGILTRMLHSDNAIEDVALVIFDEFHERNLHADVALALCREAQSILRPDLKLMIMSATLNTTELTALLKAPLIESKGRQYPVDVFYEDQQDEWMMAEIAARIISKATKKHDGDVLAFFPGQGEIIKCEEVLRKDMHDFAIHPLYGSLPHGKQMAAILPNRDGKRKIVLATSIAETSLTIEGIKIVVDTGFGRTSKFDIKSGLSKLETVQISQDSADQRAGRAGRLSPGVCYRLWSKATQDRLQKHLTPEIMEADLASLVLDMAQWGISNVQEMTWLTPPPNAAVLQARELLHQLGALDNNKITPHGQRLHQLPCHPRIAHMLRMTEEQGLIALASDIAALLDERDPLGKEAGTDINERIEVLRRLRRDNRLGRKFSRIEKVAQQYRQLFSLDAENDSHDPYETGILLSYAYPERIAYARPGNNAQFQLSNGKYAMLGHRDDLANEPWLAIAHMDARDGMGKIFMASPLNPRDLMPMVEEKEIITWDTRQGGLIASLDLRIGSITLRSTPLSNPDESRLVEAICDTLKKEGERLLNWEENVTQWQNRVLSLRQWNPNQGWPDVSTPTLLATNHEWLAPYLEGIKKPEALKKIDLKSVLQHSLAYDLQGKLDALAPVKINVPSGSHIKLNYAADGSAPILAVRLQEVFGLVDTPKINEGKTSVLMHLLSPGYKPVQITSDLNSFWNNAYFEVRKDLRGRYPKHVWPEDPWQEQAISGVKRKK
ncbi:ATP-dependent helicase HrpB [Reichenbachiella sp. MSK19-1]|uniref:ATP-dependent helicase HrpB n=1 Tax=Reichenbachiella sp. MSK19-1 TaxID=1897631 RepID=UPI000E6B897E|nr:ATP-dependent helicase HrpB [Reichenbachiella sp. MSK19-1]RJE74735.1 ATP-dependent helicase HrpB [Reichenbachiella sp. MSK19-1]